MTTISRESLRPLEGQLVYFQGFMESWRKGAGTVDACLRNLKVRPWDGECPIDDCRQVIRLDHAWLRVTSENWIFQPKRWSSYEAVGRVGWYRRRDGSVDLGLSTVPSLCLDSALDGIFDRLKGSSWGERVSSFEALQDSIEAHQKRGLGAIYSHARSVSDGVAEIARFRERLRRDQAVNIAALTTAIGRGPCERLDAGIRFQPHRARAASGFA